MSQTATQRLRELLDERGVEWQADDTDVLLHTVWKNEEGQLCSYFEAIGEGSESWHKEVSLYDCLPEQAIAATLGSGTLTAEQVRELIAPHLHARPTFDFGRHGAVWSADFQAIADELNAELGSEINGDTSDGYHTFNELYHHRAVLFSVIVRDHRELAWKARKHHDGTMYEGMFIVGIETPKGQATYHYDLDPYWEMFDCEEREYAPEWDGHTPDDAIARIAELGSECDKWKAKAEEAGRAMNAAAGLWAKADAENRELRKMLLLDDGTVEEYTERADPLTALAYQKQLAEEWRDRCHNAEALCDKIEAERDELNAKLGSGTCELHYGEDDDGYDGWYCDECSGWFQAVRRDGHLVKPKHCQECGAKVVD